jgi:hypothetical protein
MKSQLKGGSFSEGARCAEHARTAKANTLHKTPPSGPKPEPVRLNGVPKVGGNGIK